MITLSSTYLESQYFLSRILLVKKFLLPHLAPVSMDLNPSFLYFILKFCYSAFLYFMLKSYYYAFLCLSHFLRKGGTQKILRGKISFILKFCYYVFLYFILKMYYCAILCVSHFFREGRTWKNRKKEHEIYGTHFNSQSSRETRGLIAHILTNQCKLALGYVIWSKSDRTYDRNARKAQQTIVDFELYL